MCSEYSAYNMYASLPYIMNSLYPLHESLVAGHAGDIVHQQNTLPSHMCKNKKSPLNTISRFLIGEQSKPT